MELELPQLYHHFKDEGVNPVLYASEWFSTLFAYNFPLEIGTDALHHFTTSSSSSSSCSSAFGWSTVVRLWDVFLAEGNEFLFKVALAVLKVRLASVTHARHDTTRNTTRTAQHDMTFPPPFFFAAAVAR